jgi:hypothetical protein
MIKRELRSTIKNLLHKYAKGAEYHNEVVDRAIERVLNQLYITTFLADPLFIQRYVKRFGGTTAIAVSHDAVSGLYFSLYPTGYSFVPLPDKASGVRRVSTVVQGGVTFYPIDQREMELISSGSYYSNVSTKIGYCVTQDRIEYLGMTPTIATAGVRLDMLVPFSDYGENDEILIPEIPNADKGQFTDTVLMILSVIQPIETKDDNVTTPQIVKK